MTRNGRIWVFEVAAGAIAALTGSGAFGQWTAIDLNPPGATNSYITASADGRFGGAVQPAGTNHDYPALWDGLGTGWTNLLGVAAPYTAILSAMSGNQQGGLYNGAALWTGTPESRVDMGGLQILGMAPGQQAGTTLVDVGGSEHTHAAIWSGTSQSLVDLNPTGFGDSMAYATDGQRQGGYVRISSTMGGHMAAMWSGTASTFVNLNPQWSSYSEIRGMVPGQQVGSAQPIGTLPMHATIWNGTAQSAIDVDPFPGGGGSYLLATTGSVQVGNASVPGYSFQHAGVWFGTAASFVDLHQFLPPGYAASAATTVQEWNGMILVGGWATRDLGHDEAFVWVLAPAPGGAATIFGAAGLVAMRRRRRVVSKP